MRFGAGQDFAAGAACRRRVDGRRDHVALPGGAGADGVRTPRDDPDLRHFSRRTVVRASRTRRPRRSGPLGRGLSDPGKTGVECPGPAAPDPRGAARDGPRHPLGPTQLAGPVLPAPCDKLTPVWNTLRVISRDPLSSPSFPGMPVTEKPETSAETGLHDHSLGAQAGALLRTKAVRRQYFVRMFTEQRRTADMAGAFRQLRRQTGGKEGSQFGMGNPQQHLARGDLRMRKNLFHRQDWT